MLKVKIQKITLLILTLLIALEPVFLNTSFKAKAADENEAPASIDEGEDYSPTENYSGTLPSDSAPSSLQSLESKMATADNSGNLENIFSLDEKIMGMKDARIILTPNDLQAIRSLYCLSNLMSDFEFDLEALYNNLPDSVRPASQDELLKIKFEQPAQFQRLIAEARKNWGQTSEAKTLLNQELEAVLNLQSNDTTGLNSALTQNVGKNLSCITGLSTNELMEADEDYLRTSIDAALESLVIDIRVLKTLVYLVTPKNQGGAGHWRIRVKKLTQLNARPFSNESEAVRLSLGKETDSTDTANCTNMTAAECGREQTGDGSDNVEVEDEDGQTYNAYLESLDNAETDSRLNIPDKNISAHVDGKAIDISEVDDIRCTLVVKKKRRIGGTSTTKEKKVIRPTKLAWQTSESYDQSGGNSVDMMGILKSVAADEVSSLLADLNGDTIDYEGDLSDANFTDIVNILGKTIFAQLLGSPGHDLSGFDATETMKKLGGIYFADYLGLPREVFVGRNYDSLEDVEYLIGESAMEQRAGVPYGSFSAQNTIHTGENGKIVYNLEGTLFNVGQRKLEYEMSLNPGDLDGYITPTGTSAEPFDQLIGKRAIEKDLNIPENMFRGDNFRDLKKNLGDVRAAALFLDPTYDDSALHIAAGSTRDLMDGKLSPTQFIELIGSTRKNDTINGLVYLSANDAAYNLPEGTWENALLGNKDSFISIGAQSAARIFGQDLTFSKYLNSQGNSTISEEGFIRLSQSNVKADPNELGFYAARQWLLDNLGKTDKTTCQIPENITQKITVKVTTTKDGSSSIENKDLDVAITEDKAYQLGFVNGDLYRMFGCASANPRSVFERVGSKLLYYGIANKILDDEHKTKIDLLDTDPQLHVDNPEIQFYLSRLTRAKDLANKIRDDWKDETESDLGPIREHLDAISSQVNDIGNIFNVKAAKDKIRKIGFEIDRLKIDYEQLRLDNAVKARQINRSIIDVDELIRITSEIMAGKTILSSDLLSINQIQLGSELSSSTGGSDSKSSRGSKTSQWIFGFAIHNLDATDLFVRLGASQAEASLDLPENSLYYLVQNYERAGIKNLDAFYMAIGQAKIEEEFGLPSFYFQGDVLNTKMPNFENDLGALAQYAYGEVAYTRWTMMYISAAYPKDADFLKVIKQARPDIFNSMVSSAKESWRTELRTSTEARAGNLMFEKDLSDVAANVAQRKYNDGIRSAEDDVLFRMGIYSKMAALTDGAFSLTAERQAKAADKRLSIDDGSTKALIQKQKVKLANGEDLLASDEKNQLVASMNLSKEALDVFLKLLNGDISLNELNKQGLNPDYVNGNPYLKQYGENEEGATSCPISYELKQTGSTVGRFVVNELTWDELKSKDQRLNNIAFENDTYCVTDKKGRHCFKNKIEAQSFVVEHSGDQYDNIIWQIASVLNQYFNYEGDSGAIPSTEDIYSKLISFINGSNNSVFSEEELEQLANIVDPQFSSYGFASIPTAVLKKLFSRESVDRPLPDYKLAVGKAEAKKKVSWKLFTSLGINIDPRAFDSGDLYSIISGDYRPLNRVGAFFIDESLNMNPGTTQLIVSAFNPRNLKCGLAQAGATMLGSIVGLDSVPIKGTSIHDIPRNIGQAKVEETLGLQRGTFYGSSMDEIIARIKPINFALQFKIPLTIERADSGETTTLIDYNDMAAILGSRRAETLRKATGPYQLKMILGALSTMPALSGEASAALNRIDDTLKTYVPIFLDGYGTGQYATPEAGGNKKDYNYEVNQFLGFVTGLDGTFGLDTDTTASLFRKSITPDQYIKRIGDKMILRLGAVQLGQAFGLDDATSEAAADLAMNFQSFFSCKTRSPFNEEECIDDNYQNWGLLYSNLQSIFHYDLDSKAKLPPGTFQRILNNPDDAHWVLLNVAAKRLDERMQLPRSEGFFDSPLFTFTELYKRSYAYASDRTESRRSQDQDCINSTLAQNQANPDQIRIAIQANNKLIEEGQKENATDEDRAAGANAQADNDRLLAQTRLVDTQVQTCQNGWRKAEESQGVTDFWTNERTIMIDWIKEGVSDSIANRIREVEVNGERVGVNMPIEDVYQLVFEGDIRYLEIVTIALAINIYQVKNTDERHPVPASMRISYDDIKQAFFPDAIVLQAAGDAAVWANHNNEAWDSSRTSYGYGELCPPGDFIQSLVTCTSDTTTTNVPLRDEPHVANANVQRINEGYGYNPSTAPPFHTDEVLADDASARKEGERNAKELFKKDLEYKMLDQMIYGADQNIFPGFSRALMSGDDKLKASALTTYVKNGLRNGKIFGVEFNAMPNIEDWQHVGNLIREWSGNDVTDEVALNHFIDNGGMNFLGGYLADKSEDWLGIKLSPEMTKGLIVGAVSGHWGKFGESADEYRGVQTFGGAVTDWGMSRIFQWADKALGLPVGKSYEWFKAGKEIYNVQKVYRQINNIEDVASLTDAQVKLVGNNIKGGLKPGIKPTEAQLKEAKINLKTNVQQLKVQLATLVVSYFIHKWFGEGISKLEEKWGLVPGSLGVVVDAAVGVGVAYAADVWFGASGAAMGPAMSALWVGLAIFVVMNLFGVYKVDVKLVCSADGYWPEIEAPPSASVADVSNLGLWDGMNASIMKQKSVEAAQYKASRLIGDMLTMQYNPLFKDVVPSQIMTGRQEDVQTWDRVISDNLCKWVGLKSVGGICGGNTRAGVWANPQTIAWTHIGF